MKRLIDRLHEITADRQAANKERQASGVGNMGTHEKGLQRLADEAKKKQEIRNALRRPQTK